MAFRITTTGTQSPIVFGDLGGVSFTHPVVDYDLENDFAEEDIRSSEEVQSAIDSGWITVVDVYGSPITQTRGAVSHNEIAGLNHDDHQQYPLTVGSHRPVLDIDIPTVDQAMVYDSTSSSWIGADVGNMRWEGNWIPATYDQYDVVRDDNWTMVANVDTNDRAAPQPSGDPYSVLELFDSTSSYNTQSISSNIFYCGQRYNFPLGFADAYLIRKIRTWFPVEAVGLKAEVWLVYNATSGGEGARVINLVPSFTITPDITEQWVYFGAESFVEKGTVLDAVIELKPGPASESQFSYE